MPQDFNELYKELFYGKSKKSPEEIIKLFQETLAAMPPDMFRRHFENIERMGYNDGSKKTREEIVCRLLASGMTAQEIAVILCVREAEIQDIERTYANDKIPEYAKKLKARRRRREKATTPGRGITEVERAEIRKLRESKTPLMLDE